MSGIGEASGLPGFMESGYRATPNELDRYEVVNTGILSVSATWAGTAAGGTSTQQKPLVIINKILDHPRNLLYGEVGTADHGGTWVVNGKDQFGYDITESVGSGTVAAGTPAFAIAGTKIFSEVSSGTFTTATGAVGAGSPQLGVAIGTAVGAIWKLGLLTKLAGTTDLRGASFNASNVSTSINGGTVTPYVDLTNNSFSGPTIIAGSTSYQFRIKTNYSNLGKPNLVNG